MPLWFLGQKIKREIYVARIYMSVYIYLTRVGRDREISRKKRKKKQKKNTRRQPRVDVSYVEHTHTHTFAHFSLWKMRDSVSTRDSYRFIADRKIIKKKGNRNMYYSFWKRAIPKDKKERVYIDVLPDEWKKKYEKFSSSQIHLDQRVTLLQTRTRCYLNFFFF